MTWGCRVVHPQVKRESVLPRSRPRGWLVGVGAYLGVVALLARAGGSGLQDLLKAHEGFSWGAILIAWWVGYRSYEHQNPLPVMLKDVRKLLPRRVIVWAVVGVLAFFFADPIKIALGSVLPTDVPGLAAMLFGILIVLAWETESEARKIREELKDIRDKLLDLEIEAASVTSLKSDVDSVENKTSEIWSATWEIGRKLEYITAVLESTRSVVWKIWNDWPSVTGSNAATAFVAGDEVPESGSAAQEPIESDHSGEAADGPGTDCRRLTRSPAESSEG